MGFFNESNVITEDIGPMQITFLSMAGTLIGIRTLLQLINIFKHNADKNAQFISLFVANIINVIVAYVFINLATDSEYDTGVLPQILDTALIILYAITVFGEAICLEDETGLFNLRDSLYTYFSKLENYEERKEKLINNYKQITQ